MRSLLTLLLLGGIFCVPLGSRAQTPPITPEAISSHPAWQALESWNSGINSWFRSNFRDAVLGVWRGVQNFRLPLYEDFSWPGLWNTVSGGVGGYVHEAGQDIVSVQPDNFGSRVSGYAKTAGDNAPGVWGRARAIGGQILEWLFNSSSSR